ncbi:MAG TPA: protein kinase [Pseudomonadota bacterium]|nr:protein kinase [Pseudomonadota bacterium]
MEILSVPVGTLLGNRFEVLKLAGQGGMGAVYQAQDRFSGDLVALKLLHAAAQSSDESERFLREARFLSDLQHPGIVAYLAHGQTPLGQPYLAMEWLPGCDLSQRLRMGSLSIRDTLQLVDRAADALSHAHQRGIIHRDIKPSNLFLVDGDVGKVKLLDFGVARQTMRSRAETRTGLVIGTPEYMSPEQARGSRELTPAADLFSLGCVLYECLAGEPPFVADHVAAVLVRILFEDPQPLGKLRPGLPAELCDLVAVLLHKDPALRLADARELRVRLAGLGEISEPALAATLASPGLPSEGFVYQEQSLVSVVLATAGEPVSGLGVTQPGSGVRLPETDRRQLLQALASLGGTPDFLANGTLLLTVPALVSAQDQALIAARSALLIRDRWPQSKVAMATGYGAIRGRTAVGKVVDQAAAALLSGRASEPPPGSSGVHIDPLSAELLGGRFVVTPRADHFVLLHEDFDRDDSRPLLGKPTPCVGRETELAMLEAQLRGSIDESEARMVLLCAAPGVGKSRLRHEFLRRQASRDEALTLIVGRGEMTHAGAPYGILRSALLRLCAIAPQATLPEAQAALTLRLTQRLPKAQAEVTLWFLAELCQLPFPDDGKPRLQAAKQDPKLMRDCLRDALRTFFSAELQAGPMLVVLDDLQWGDALSLSILEELLRVHASAPLFVLAFARPEVRTALPRLQQMSQVQVLTLKSLSKRACERLIIGVLGGAVPPEIVTRAVAQCAGNALFLEELIRAIAEGRADAASETVVAMLQARLGKLPARARRAVLAASVFGTRFSATGVAALVGSADVTAELTALVEAEILYSHTQSSPGPSTEYEFRHALLRDAAYALLTEADAAAGHLRAAEFLAGQADRAPAIIADHFERGGAGERAAPQYLLAVRAELTSGDTESSLRFLDRGLACTRDRRLRGEFLSLRALRGILQNQFDECVEPATQAMQLLPAGSSGWCIAIWAAQYVALARHDAGRVGELVMQLIHTDPEPSADVQYVEALMGVSSPLTWAAPAPLLQILHGRLTTYVERAAPHNPGIRRHLHFFRACLYLNREPKPWSLLSEADAAQRLSELIGDRLTAALMPFGLTAFGWVAVGDHIGLRQRLRQQGERLRYPHDAFVLPWWQLASAVNLLELDDRAAWDEAEPLIAALRSETSGSPIFPLFGVGLAAKLALLRGDAETAAGLGRQLVPTLSVLPILALTGVTSLLLALVRLGQLVEARGLAEQLLPLFSMLGGAGMHELPARIAVVEVFEATGAHAQARAALIEVLAQIKLRCDDIADPHFRAQFQSHHPACKRATTLAQAFGLPFAAPGSEAPPNC